MPQPQKYAYVPLVEFGGLISEVAATDVPEGGSPLCYNNDFLIGSVVQRPGLLSEFTYGGEDVGPNGGSNAANAVNVGAQWLNPGNILLNDSAYTTVNPYSESVSSAALQVTGFNFDLPSTVGITGFVVPFYYKQTGNATVTAQLLKAGVAIGTPKSINVSTTSGATLTFGSGNDTWGTTWTYSDVNNAEFGVQFSVINRQTGTTTTQANYTSITVYITPSLSNYNYVKSFAPPSGTVETLALDAEGIIWGENVISNPNVLNTLFTGIQPGLYAKSVTQFSREYMCFSDLQQGRDIPRQYDGTSNFDRISQCGVAAPPSVAASSSGYTISASPNGITQQAIRQTGWDDCLWSAGVGNSAPGTNITVYYTKGTQFGGLGQDPNVLVGSNVYITGLSGNLSGANGTYTVTSIGVASPPGAGYERFYFTYTVSTSQSYQAHGGSSCASATYQLTLATLTLTAPAVDVSVGSSVTLAGVGVGTWDGEWTITNALNGAQLSITSTQLNASTGVATYGFTLESGTTPATGQIVTVSGTNNGNGIFNVVNQPITGVSGGQFTILLSGPNVAAAGETGNGIINGTQFQFDPGTKYLGTTTDPIFGNSGGGTLTTGGNVGSGTRMAVCLFLTRNGAITPASPPVTFQTTGSANSLTFTNIPIGGPAVVARIIAITAANGAFFFYIPEPVTIQNGPNGQPVTYTATQINDNTTTSATFTFTDAVLLSSLSIDTQGSDYRSGVELGNSVWNISYAGRMFYGLEQNKVDNFINLSFDGGYLSNPGGEVVPLGWKNTSGGQLLVSPIYGNSYYISNLPVSSSITATSITSNVLTVTTNNSFVTGNTITLSGTAESFLNGQSVTITSATSTQFTAAFTHANYTNSSDTGNATKAATTQSVLGLISQTAYQDFNEVPIININTTYSVRVTARTPSGNTNGNLVIDLYNPATGVSYPYTIPFSSMATNMNTFTGTLLTTGFTTAVPSGLLLRLYATNIGPGADVEVDRFEVFPTEQPVNSTQVRVSYINAPEQFDGNTGVIGLSSQNEQPVLGAFVNYDILYFLKSGSLLSTQDSPNSEPSGWSVHEVSNKIGTAGPNAYDYGEEWMVTANRNGVYLFNGGEPVKLSQEIQPTWDAINWTYGYTIWLRNDIVNKRFLVGVPMATPNQWLPNAAVNANPTSPNVVVAINYRELNTSLAITTQSPMHVSYSGKLIAFDMSRKTSLWTIAAPYADFCIRPDTSSDLLLCNGISSSKIYSLSTTQFSDDGAAIDSLYTTFGFIKPDQEQAFGPLVGEERKMYRKCQMILKGTGNISLTFLANVLECYMPRSVPGGITLYQPDASSFNAGQFDLERWIQVPANRMFLQFRSNAVGNSYQLSKVLMTIGVDPMSPFSGAY